MGSLFGDTVEKSRQLFLRPAFARAVLAAFLLFLWHSAPAFSQSPGQEPGAQAERFRKETESKQMMLERKRPKIPVIQVEEGEEPALPEGAVSFNLKEVKITGATVFGPEDLKTLYEPYLGKTVTFSDLRSIALAIKAKYREKGFLTTTVYFPEQDVTEGLVEIKVVEGRLGEVKVEGSRWNSIEVLKKYIHIKKNEPVDIRKLRKDVLRLNQGSDTEIKVVLSPGKEPGTIDIILKVSDKFPYHAGSGVDNMGTRVTGKYRTSYFGRSSNMTGMMDTMFINTVFSAESSGESISYAMPLGTSGTRLAVDAYNFRMKNGREYRPLDIIGNSQAITAHVSNELYLDERFSVRSDAGIEMKSTKRRMLGNYTQNDQIRNPYVGCNFTENDITGQTVMEPKVLFGTQSFLGASKKNHPTSSRAGTGGNFVKYEQEFSRFQRMPFESYIKAKTQLQLSSVSLPSSEQFQLGGMSSIRGYPEGDYLADNGAILNMDWVFPMYLIPKDWKLPYADTPLRYQLQPAVFMDIGGGVLHRTLPGEKRDKYLAGIGAGVRFRFNRNLYLQLDWAEPIGDRPTGGGGPSTFHMSVVAEI